MNRCLGLLAALVVVAPASAHFVWLTPYKDDHVRMVFSDDLDPDQNVAITKIAQAKVHVRTDGKTTPVEKTEGTDHYLIALPGKGPCEVGAVCEYGVLTKGGGDPFLLIYHAKTMVRGAKAQGLDHALEIFPVADKRGAFEVRWQGKPLAGAEVVFIAGAEAKLKTDEHGQVVLAAPPTAGMVALRAKHVEAKAGQQGGKAYKEVRHYATLTMTVP
ncbi:MAG: DUF4198 domain-containing protein [Gemmataceae bacterium]|nr:DUF4198 domain-containing protein [Gemmataceae bacterium]